jgi:hypothetical protein
VFTKTSAGFPPYYLAGIRHDLRQTTISLNCKTSLASSKDGANVLGANETGGGSVLGSLRVNCECTPVAAATETEKEPAKETGKETEKTTE